MRPFGVRFAFNGSAEPEKEFVLTNLIQSDAALSGSSARSALPFPSAGQGTSSFASSLQSASAAPPVTPQPELGAGAQRAKSAEKKPTENSKTTASAQTTPAMVPAVIADTKLASAIALKLETTPLPSAGTAGSFATANLIEPQVLGAQAGASIGSVAPTEPATKNASVGLAGDVQPPNSAAVFQSALSTSALPTGKQAPDLAPLPYSASTLGKQVNPVPLAPTSPNRASRNESEAGQHLPAPGAQSVASQESDRTPPLKVAVLNGATQRPSPALVEFASPQSGMTSQAMGAVGDTGNATAGINQASSGTQAQAGKGDLRPLETSFLSGVSLPPTDATTDTDNTTAGVNQASPGAQVQISNGDLRPIAPTFPTGVLLPAMNAPRDTANTTTGVNQVSLRIELQSGDGNLRPLVLPPSPTGVALHTMDAAGNTLAEVNQASPGAKAQAGNGDPLSSAPTSASAGVPLDATNAAGNTGNATAVVKQASPAAKAQAANGDLGALLSTLPVAGARLDAASPSSKPTDTITGTGQSTGDSQPPSSNDSGLKIPAPSAFSFSISSTVPSSEIAKAVSLRPTLGMKATETISVAGAPAKEIPSPKVPPNQDHATSKAADTSSSLTDANAHPTSPAAAPAAPTGQATAGDASSPVTAANILPQVSLATTQDAGSRNTAAPAAAESQSSATNSPTPLPAVGTVETARLVASVAQSEMHLGLQTQAFGNVEVHTVVRDSQVGLTVGSERGDLRTLLAPEVSGLQATFRQQDLRFDNIRFLDSSAGTTAGFSGGADSQGRSPSQPHSSPGGLFSIHGPPEDPAEPNTSDRLRTGLNVLA